MHDAATARTLHEIVAKRAMFPLVLFVDNCSEAFERLSELGVEFTQEPVERFSGSFGQRIEDDRSSTHSAIKEFEMNWNPGFDKAIVVSPSFLQRQLLPIS